jgi:hypothetical protein
MTNTEKTILFLASQQQTNEVIDLMRIAKGIEQRILMHKLIEYVIMKRSEADTAARNHGTVDDLQLYLGWQRVLDMIWTPEPHTFNNNQKEMF